MLMENPSTYVAYTTEPKPTDFHYSSRWCLHWSTLEAQAPCHCQLLDWSIRDNGCSTEQLQTKVLFQYCHQKYSTSLWQVHQQEVLGRHLSVQEQLDNAIKHCLQYIALNKTPRIIVSCYSDLRHRFGQAYPGKQTQAIYSSNAS